MILDNSSTIVTMERSCCNLIPSKVLQKSNLPQPSPPRDSREAICEGELEREPWMAEGCSNAEHESCSLHQFRL